MNFPFPPQQSALNHPSSLRRHQPIRPLPPFQLNRYEPPLLQNTYSEGNYLFDRVYNNPYFQQSRNSDRCLEVQREIQQQNATLAQNRPEQDSDSGYTSPALIERLRERIPLQNDVQQAQESLVEQIQWVPRPPFSAIRLWHPMYAEAEQRAREIRERTEWAVRTYGRSDIIEPFYVPSDELVVSQADMTTDCETQSFMRSQAEQSIFGRNPEPESFQQRRPNQQVLVIVERSQNGQSSKNEESERNSKLAPLISSKEVEQVDPNAQGQLYHPSQSSLYVKSGPEVSQQQVFSSVPSKHKHSDILYMNFHQLSQSIMKRLKSMDEILLIERNDRETQTMRNTSSKYQNKQMQVEQQDQFIKRIQIFRNQFQTIEPQKFTIQRPRNNLNSNNFQVDRHRSNTEMEISQKSQRQRAESNHEMERSQKSQRERVESNHETERSQKSQRERAESNHETERSQKSQRERVESNHETERSQKSRQSQRELGQSNTEMEISQKSQRKSNIEKKDSQKQFDTSSYWRRRKTIIDPLLKTTREASQRGLGEISVQNQSQKSKNFNMDNTSIKERYSKTQSKVFAEDFVEYEKEKIQMSREQSNQRILSDSEQFLSQKLAIKNETSSKNNSSQKDNLEFQEQSETVQSSQKQNHPHFMSQNQQEVSAIYPIGRKINHRTYGIENQSLYLKSSDCDEPLTISQKKSIMNIFDKNLNDSSQQLFRRFNQFQEICQIKEANSKFLSEPNNQFQKMEKKALNYVNYNLSEVSKEMEFEISPQNYKTVPDRIVNNEDSSELSKPPMVPEFRKLHAMMRDKDVKESLMETESCPSKNWEMKNSSDSANSRNGPVNQEKRKDNTGDKMILDN